MEQINECIVCDRIETCPSSSKKTGARIIVCGTKYAESILKHKKRQNI